MIVLPAVVTYSGKLYSLYYKTRIVFVDVVYTYDLCVLQVLVQEGRRITRTAYIDILQRTTKTGYCDSERLLKKKPTIFSTW